MAEASSSREKPHPPPELTGTYPKWANYVQGYQRRYFVLKEGMLSYYRHETDVSLKCRGVYALRSAIISLSHRDTIMISNGGEILYIRIPDPQERQNWLSALEAHQSYARKTQRIPDEEDDVPDTSTHDKEVSEMIASIKKRVTELKLSGDLVPKHFQPVERLLQDLAVAPTSVQSKEFNEWVTLFRVTSKSFVNKATEFSEWVQIAFTKYSKLLQHERERRLEIEELLTQLARQQLHLEDEAKKASVHSNDDSDKEEFFDAMYGPSENESFDDWKNKTQHSSESDLEYQNRPGLSAEVVETASQSSSEVDDDDVPPIEAYNLSRIRGPYNQPAEVMNPPPPVPERGHAGPSAFEDQPMDPQAAQKSRARKRRTRIPDKPDQQISLWGIMRNCIGRDLSKIPMPVNFSEPLSMLQRLAEDFEYSDILDKAAKISNPLEQLAFVAAFTVSAYSTTALRTGKPFNPLLGETYECDRSDDKGWRIVSEQVSHHPPMFSQHCDGNGWTAWQEFTMASKFRGKFLQVIPMGMAHLEMQGNHYSWRKVTTTVHNIIVGKLWIDQHGDMEISNHTTGDVCILKFIPYSYFAKEPQRRVTGYVQDVNGQQKFVINGHWDQFIDIAPVKGIAAKKEVPSKDFYRVWTVNKPPEESKKYYNFSEFACQLNEPEEGVAPTDSRLRPDQRLMENGDWSAANEEKLRLEEKQREARKQREIEMEAAARRGENIPEYEPRWFVKEENPNGGGYVHVYNGRYWAAKAKQEWTNCPDIF